ncbi:MAG: hypothetical protein C5B50_02745 [Verrucomicrobia bacterium]|nr:MAG: hypothetical protein C5B50_02745 [Verrucomicrobiota bacterium]
MKLRTCLWLSLTLNTILIGAAGWLAVGRSQPKVSEGPRQLRSKPPLRAPDEAAAPLAASEAQRPRPSTLDPLPLAWTHIESTDYRVYIANLRGLGCPEQTVRDLVLADVNGMFAARVKELVDGVTDKFWPLLSRPDEFQKVVDEKKAELDKMQQERRAMLGALLGQEDPRADENKAIEEAGRREASARLADFLPDEKRDRFVAEQEGFALAQSKLAQTPDFTGPERAARQKDLQDAHNRAISDLLTPEETQELRLRQSDTTQLRSRLNGIEVSEDEVRTLAKLQLAHQETQMAEVLGPERFAAFERAGDTRFTSIQRVAQRVGLPDEIALEVFQMRNTAEQSLRAVQQDPSLSDDDRRALLQTLGQETRRSIADTFGPNAFTAYERLDGAWLQQFNAR